VTASPEVPADVSSVPQRAAGRAGPVAQAEIEVDGMHCESCARLIQEVLAEQAGVLDASVDLPGARAHVEYDTSQLGLDQLTGAIAAAGYSATPVG
jgi:copper chaperone CopZ